MSRRDNARLITASGDIAKAIDAGADIDADIKDMTKEDKALKAKIVEAAKTAIELNEVSIRMQGIEHAALITAATSFTLNKSTTLMPEIVSLIKEGVLTGVIDRNQSLAISQDDIEKAAEILKQAGVEAPISESFVVNGEGYRKFKKEFAEKEFVDKLDRDVAKDVTFRVKYERKSEDSE